MKSLHIKILVLFAFGGMVAEGQITTPIQTSSVQVINVTQMAKAYFTQEVSLGNYSGVDFTDAGLIALLTEAQKVKDSLDYDVFTVEFPYVSTTADLGLDENYQLAVNQIQSEKYLLFCFVLSSDDSEEVAKFYTAIQDGLGARSPETDALQGFINDQVQSFFNESDVFSKAFEAEANGLKWWLDYVLNSSDFTLDLSLYAAPSPSPFFEIQEEKTFISPAGIPIPLPGQSKVAFYPKGHSRNGMLYRFKIPDSDNVLHEYHPYKWVAGVHTGKFTGYGNKEGDDPVSFFSYELPTPPFTPSQDGKPPYENGEYVIVHLGFFDNGCDNNQASDNIKFEKKLYQVSWEDQSGESDPEYPDLPIHRGQNEYRTYEDLGYGLQESIIPLWNTVTNNNLYYGDNLTNLISLPNVFCASYTETFPCFVYDIEVETEYNGLGSLEADVKQFKIHKFNDGTTAVLWATQGKKFVSYWIGSLDPEYITLVYDSNYGWQPASFIYVEGYVQGFYELLEWAAEKLVSTAGTVAWIAVNIYIGNVVAVYGTAVALVADIGLAGIEAGYVYATTGDSEEALYTFVIAAGATVFGTALSKGIHAYRKAKAAAKAAGLGDDAIKAGVRFGEEAGEIIEKNLDEFDNYIRNNIFNHINNADEVDVLVNKVLQDLEEGDDLAKWMLEDFDRVKAWEILKNGPHRLKIGALELFSDPAVLASRQNILENGIDGLFPNIAVEELTAIRHYTTNSYSELNTALRSGAPSDYFKSFEEILNDGLNKLPEYNGSEVFRGVSGGEATLAKTWNVGDDINFKDFKSTSTSTSVANNFTGDVFYEIANPKGKAVCNISCIVDESEVLFKSSSNFKVNEIAEDFIIYDKDFNPISVTKIFLEYVN